MADLHNTAEKVEKGTSDLKAAAATLQSEYIKKKQRLLLAGELAGIFLLAMLLRCLYNYYLPHVNNFASCDAFEYINNAQALLKISNQAPEFWQKVIGCLLGVAGSTELQSVKDALAPMKDFYISGPVFPAFLALSVAAVGGATANAHALWPVLLFSNSLVSALSCVFIALLTAEAYDRRSARLAGILAAFYPGFIVNSGRLYSETFATFLLVFLSYLTLRGFRSGGNSMWTVCLSGFLAAGLQLTRSVMFVLSFALLPITSLQQKGLKKVLFIVPFALGFALVALPWLGFQKLAFGGGGLVVDRVGHYNFFIGNNIETHGWLSYPYPDGRNVEARTFPELARQAVSRNPQRWLRLMLDKPLRLFAFPWNDFRTPIGPFKFEWQVLLHQMLLSFSILGIPLTLFLSAGRAPERRQLFCRFYIAGLLLFHCIYYLFITVPRYNLTAMPELIIFASAGISTVYLLLKEKLRFGVILTFAGIALPLTLMFNLIPFLVATGIPADVAWIVQALCRVLLLILTLVSAWNLIGSMQGKRGLSRALAVGLLLCFVPLFALPLRANGRTFEWYQDISLSTPALKQVVQVPLSAFEESRRGVASLKGRDLFLLIDTDGVRQRADGFDLSINGVPITEPILPSMAFAENFERFLEISPGTVQREGERMWDSLTGSANCGNIDLRQWSILPVPAEIIAGAIGRAEAEGQDFVRFELSIQNRSLKALRVYGTYPVGKSERTIPSVAVYSWEKVFYGVENRQGLTDTRYDIKVPSQTLPPTETDLSDAPGLQNGVLNVALLAAPPQGAVKRAGFGLVSELQLPAANIDSSGGKQVSLRIDDLGFNSEELWVYRLKGRSRVLQGQVSPAVEVDTVYTGSGSEKRLYKSSWAPRRLITSREWKDFELVIPVKPSMENSRLAEAIVNLDLTSPDSPYLNILTPVKGQVEFADLNLEIYRLPANPIGLGHQVY